MPYHTEKNQRHFSPTAGSKAACMKLQNKQVNITYGFLTHPLVNNPAQPPNTTEKRKQ
jgi:hypothetical protein